MVYPPFMPTKLTKNIILTLILCLAFLLRSFNIGSFPSLNPDEAALGYNAYSLLLTGLDEHGISWPLHFKSFGDFKPGGYVYLALPFIKYLGLTPLAVRLPNLILSVLTVLLVYKLLIILTTNFWLATCSSFILSFSPWHVHFSRGAWESSAALFFIVLGTYFFYSYVINHKSNHFLFSCLSFVASLYIYHSARLITPLLVIFLLLTQYQLLITNYKKLIFSIFLAIILTIPVLVSFVQNGGTARFSGVGLTADTGPLARSEELLNQHRPLSLIYRLIHNRRVLYIVSWSQKYLSHFNYNFLFQSGDSVPRSRSPDIGQLYLIELPILIIGFLYLSTLPSTRILFHLTLALLLISPIASSLTFQAPSALRSLPLVIPLSILIGAGLYRLFLISASHFPHNLFIISIIYIYSIFYFVDAYFIHAPQRYPYAWNTGFSDLMPFIDTQKSKFDNIYFTSTYDQPYILYLFYNRYSPSLIQSQIQLTAPDKYGFSTVDKIDNIYFKTINWDEIPPHSLVITGTENVPSLPNLVINFPDGQIAFKIYEK